MTADGITDEDWEKVRELAAHVADAAFHGRENDCGASLSAVFGFGSRV